MSDKPSSEIDFKQLNANYFELFNLPPSFEVNKKDLRSHYKTVMSKCHPDRFVSNSEADKNAALAATSHVTQAYNILKSPPKRAAYLLELLGLFVNSNANLSSDPLFLLDQLELRERLENVPLSENPDSLLQTVIGEAKSLQSEQGQLFSVLYEQLQTLRQSEDQEKLLQNAQDSILKLRFLEKLFEEISALQHKLLD